MEKYKTLRKIYEDSRKEEYNQYLYKQLSPREQERYTIIPDLEGPQKLRSGKIVYYDPAEGQYYDRDADMYLSADEIQMHSEDVDYTDGADQEKGIISRLGAIETYIQNTLDDIANRWRPETSWDMQEGFLDSIISTINTRREQDGYEPYDEVF